MDVLTRILNFWRWYYAERSSSVPCFVVTADVVPTSITFPERKTAKVGAAWVDFRNLYAATAAVNLLRVHGALSCICFGCMPPLSMSSQPISFNPSVSTAISVLTEDTDALSYTPLFLSNLFMVARPILARFDSSLVDQSNTARAARICRPVRFSSFILISLGVVIESIVTHTETKTIKMIVMIQSYCYDYLMPQFDTGIKNPRMLLTAEGTSSIMNGIKDS